MLSLFGPQTSDNINCLIHHISLRPKIKPRTTSKVVQGISGSSVDNKKLVVVKGKDNNVTTTPKTARSSLSSVKLTERTAAAVPVAKKVSTEGDPRSKAGSSTKAKKEPVSGVKVPAAVGSSVRIVSKEGKRSSIDASKQTPQSKAQVLITANNVMNTVHNVTVASPTMKRKEASVDEIEEQRPSEETPAQKQRIRTKTRTIDPEQSVMQKMLQQRVEQEVEVTPTQPQPPAIIHRTPSPIAFEISLDSCPVVSSENEYEDDFESYESDFESEPSGEEEEQEGEVENYPGPDKSTKDEERKLDSGNYDLTVAKDRSLLVEIQEDAEQVDQDAIVVNSLKPKKTSTMSTRQLNLMKTLSLETSMTFHIFEQKPMDYERFMRVFGHLSSSQVAVQTKFEDVCHEEVQTDEIEMNSRWTQNPPQFGKGVEVGGLMFTKSNKKYQEEAVGVGIERGVINRSEVPQLNHTHVDYERLNRFLISSSNTIAQIINNKSADKDQGKRSPLDHFNEYLQIEANTLSTENAYKVKSLYTFGHVIVIVLETEEDGHGRVDFLELFHSSYLKAPQSVLVSRNKITSVLVHSKCPSYLLGGTAEG